VELRDAVAHHDLHTYAEYKAHILTLGDDPDTVFKTFKKTQTQQSIFRAMREGVRVERRTDERALREFIRLNAITRRRHGIPPQPDSFLRLLRERILEPGHGFISLAIYNGSVIGSAIFLHFGRTVIYKYGASTEESLSLRPNHAVMWDAIRWALEQGYRHFHFGRSDLSNEGLIRYKRGWGTEESVISYVRLGDRARAERSEGKMSALLRAAVGRTPIPILKAVGRILYRHIG
jgi:lipid II:glycine glycyltransferase (peptidoglycan interpeptide bridge formation enzyme)